MKLLTQERGSE